MQGPLGYNYEDQTVFTFPSRMALLLSLYFCPECHCFFPSISVQNGTVSVLVLPSRMVLFLSLHFRPEWHCFCPYNSVQNGTVSVLIFPSRMVLFLSLYFRPEWHCFCPYISVQNDTVSVLISAQNGAVSVLVFPSRMALILSLYFRPGWYCNCPYIRAFSENLIGLGFLVVCSYIKPTHEKIFAVGKSGPDATFDLFFLGLGWPWVGEFVGFTMILIRFPTNRIW